MRPSLPGSVVALLVGAFAAPAHADCTCRAQGVVATHGQTLCITTPSGTRLARCDKVLNVASWIFLNAPCPLASVGADSSVASVADDHSDHDHSHNVASLN